MTLSNRVLHQTVIASSNNAKQKRMSIHAVVKSISIGYLKSTCLTVPSSARWMFILLYYQLIILCQNLETKIHTYLGCNPASSSPQAQALYAPLVGLA